MYHGFGSAKETLSGVVVEYQSSRDSADFN